MKYDVITKIFGKGTAPNERAGDESEMRRADNESRTGEVRCTSPDIQNPITWEAGGGYVTQVLYPDLSRRQRAGVIWPSPGGSNTSTAEK